MQSYLTNPFMWLLTVLGLIAGLFWLRTFIGYRNVARDALSDYDYKLGQNMIPKGLSKDRYAQLYKRANNPRQQAYIASTTSIILIGTPVIFYILEWGLRMAYNLSGQSRTIEPGYLVWKFMIFFLVIMCWTGIGYLAARRYHRLKPGPLHYEIEQELYKDDL